MSALNTAFRAGALLVLATTFVSPSGARAQGQFDGKWVLNSSAVNPRARQASLQTCDRLKILFEIKDGQVAGNYGVSTSVHNEIVARPGGSPMTGSVQPDGSFTFQWEGYNATGKITGNNMVAQINGQCGPRSAKGTRAG